MDAVTVPLPARRPATPDHGRPASAGRVPDRAERRADAVVHRLGLAAGVAGAVALLAAQEGGVVETGAVAIYAVGLLAMLGSSAAYNMARPSRTKWWLRRADHAAIFLMIAATYTPFLARLRDVGFAGGMATFVWTGAIGGMILKLGWPGRFDRLSVLLYLGLGWAIVAVAGPLSSALATSTLVLLAAGGLLYTLGVPFHLWERLRFQTAIWHGFVLAAAGCHYAAVFDLMVLSA